MTTTQLLAIALTTVSQFVVGAIWYTPLFGKLWGKIHGFDKLDKKVQQKMMSEMGPLFGVQLIVTIVTSLILVVLHTQFPSYSLSMLTFWIWLGFVVPSQVSAVLFSNTPKKWMLTKSFVLAGGSLVCLLTGALVAAAVLG